MLHKAYLYGDFGAYFANTPLLLSDLVQAVILGIIIIVMAVPEGLPLMIAIVSSLNMKKCCAITYLCGSWSGSKLRAV